MAARITWILAVSLLAAGGPLGAFEPPVDAAAPAAPAAAMNASAGAATTDAGIPTAGRNIGADIIGMDLPAAVQAFGAPAEVFPRRGEEPWQDDVVFYFDSHLYLFWFRGRVWQVRMDRRFESEFLGGLRMGMARREVLSRLGPPLAEADGFLLYHLEDRGYPIRLRLLFEEDRLSDAYCYRSDI